MQLITTAAGSQVWVTPKQVSVITALTNAHKGGIARAIGYTATSGRTTPEVADYTFTSRFSVEKFYNRKLDQLNDLDYVDVLPYLASDPKLALLDTQAATALFEARKEQEIASMETTLSGLRDDAHRQAHDRCYGRITDGCVLHYVTEKVGKYAEPVLQDGHPVCASVMVDALIIRKDITTPGEYKPTNPGDSVRMRNAINSAVKDLYPSNIEYRRLSLKDDNFEEIRIGGTSITEAEEITIADLV